VGKRGLTAMENGKGSGVVAPGLEWWRGPRIGGRRDGGGGRSVGRWRGGGGGRGVGWRPRRGVSSQRAARRRGGVRLREENEQEEHDVGQNP
jgi:hypothetical protein